MIADIIISVLLIVAGVFGVTGSFGLLKLNDPMKRLHAPTKATTLGVGAALLASIFYSGAVVGRLSWQEPLIIVFLFIASPVTAHFLSKVHLHRNMKPADLPPTGTGRDWATFEPDDMPERDGNS